MWQEFKTFVMKGNVLDLAIAVILGAAFTNIVTALNAGVLTPIVSAVIGKSDFSALTLSIGDAHLRYGAVLQTTVDFLMTALVLFLIVKAYNKSLRAKKPEAPAAPKAPSETDLLAEIRDLLRAR
jgi:large conductance mechanosensitive channel